MYKIAIVQMDSQADRKQNLSKASELCKKAIAMNARLIAFPEAVSVVDTGETAPEHAENGPTASLMRELARNDHVWIMTGSFYECNPNGLRFNTSLLINPQGNITAKYRKLHLFDASLPDGTVAKESSRTAPGSKIIVANTELGNIGMSVCYDIRFPELYRLMAMKGADILMVPAAFAYNTGSAGHWETLLRARAIENGCYVVAPAQIGAKRKGTFVTYGHSMVIDPWGKVLVNASEKEGVYIADIDLDKVNDCRSHVPSLANRRSDICNLKDLSTD